MQKKAAQQKPEKRARIKDQDQTGMQRMIRQYLIKNIAAKKHGAGMIADPGQDVYKRQRIESKKEWINELNVFPVPDGDTGTNMTMTIMSAAREVSALTDPDMESLSKAISQGALRGARGNSGVILSQLFRGFTRPIKDEKVIDSVIAAEAFKKASETAYKAVMKPKEGTILTVARGMAEKAADIFDATDDLEEGFRQIIEYGDYMLSLTPEMLPVLKQAGVVESGGQGLMTVLKGAYDCLTGAETCLLYTSRCV